MNLDGAFLSSLVRGGVPLISRARGMGITEEHIDDANAKKALLFVYEYASKYKEAPPKQLLVAKTGVDLDDHPGSPDFFIDEMMNKRLYRELQQGLHLGVSMLDAGEPRQCYGHLEDLLREIRRDRMGASPIENLFQLGPEVIKQYEEIASGKRGIETRWPAINQATLGFWPQDLCLIVARVATGKTWSSIIIAHDAWAGESCEFDGMQLKKLYRKACQDEVETIDEETGVVSMTKCGWIGPSEKKEDDNDKCPKCGGEVARKGYRVLFVTTEISKLRIASRFYAVRYKLPYHPFRSGKLTKFQEDRFRSGVEELENMEGMYVVGGDFDFTMGGLETAIEEAEPDIMVLDGAYLIRASGKTRTEQAANVFNDLKRLLHRYQIAGVITSQLNRQANASQRGTVNTETIALTDAAGWNSDVVIGMIQSDDDKAAKRMWFKPLKVREGEGKERELQWNFDTMIFDELPVQAQQPGDFDDGTSDADDSDVAEEDVIF